MIRKPLVFVAALVVGTAPMVATARTARTKADPVAAVQVAPPLAAPARRAQVDWTGFHVGAALGVGEASWPNGNTTSVIGTVFAGYKADLGDVVLGADLAFAPAAALGSFTTNNEELRYGLSLMGSAGMTFGPERRTLVSISAGPALVRTRDSGGTSRNANGLSLGLGVEQMMDNNLLLRTGVTYSRFNSVGAADERVNALAGHIGAAFRF